MLESKKVVKKQVLPLLPLRGLTVFPYMILHFDVGREKFFTHSIRGISLTFTSVSGVFAFSNKIDRASGLLAEHFIPSGRIILDMGCGYGVIGLFLKAIFSDQQVYMTDINSRAVDYTLLNAKKNSLKVEVVKSNLFENIRDIKFDDIVSNPPIAAGKKLITELINQSYEHLNRYGALWLVAFHNKGGASLKGIMKSRFGNVEDICKSGGIRIYKSVKQD